MGVVEPADSIAVKVDGLPAHRVEGEADKLTTGAGKGLTRKRTGADAARQFCSPIEAEVLTNKR